jgi:hypothetical protein
LIGEVVVDADQTTVARDAGKEADR